MQLKQKRIVTKKQNPNGLGLGLLQNSPLILDIEFFFLIVHHGFFLRLNIIGNLIGLYGIINISSNIRENDFFFFLCF